MGLQALDNMMHQAEMFQVIQILHAQEFFYVGVTFLSQRHGFCFFFNGIVLLGL